MSRETAIGPVVSQASVDRIIGYIERALDSKSSRLVAGGRRVAGQFSDGYFVEPTVFADVDPDAELASQEIFGPVLSIMRFKDEAEAIRIANMTPFGLASYVQTNEVMRVHRVASELDAGMVWVNGFGGLVPSTPFGGVKQSGIGRIGGQAGIAEFSRVKNVWIGSEPPDLSNARG